MKKYIVTFYNRFACETQLFRVMADDGNSAERLFWLKYSQETYQDCIEGICEAEEHYYTEEELINIQ